MSKRLTNLFVLCFSVLVVSGCTILATKKYDELYGGVQPQNRVLEFVVPGQVDYWSEVKPILDNRCVVCHACYDAPCQLKLTAPEGIDRGAKDLKVYNASRLLEASPTRLFEDASTTQAWRNKGFFPVLNEYQQTPDINQQASLLTRFLELKQQHPLPDNEVLPDSFTLAITRKESCPSINEFDVFAQQKPLWGMPYGLPKLSDSEHQTITDWVAQGGRYTARPELSDALQDKVARWEVLLNKDTLKGQLVNRYIYEHLFLAHLYFDDIAETVFFKLVRSSTPPGQTVQQIATHRPYDDPQVPRVYYRLVPELETIVAKTHKPYVLNEKRWQRWQALFYTKDYVVTELPSYEAKVAGNPFVSFAQLPMVARYKFMLDEAQFTLMNFVKGSVCRGQVAVNVIRDRFWIFFVDPDLPINDELSDALIMSQAQLELPSVQQDIYVPLKPWIKYAANERQLGKARDVFLDKHFNGKLSIDLNNIWNGAGSWDGQAYNANAGLTVLRHFDSASIEKGLLGGEPETAWVISYPLLERIHYLLVAGYDVYGNLGHQLLSRLHMDFLRMDGETTFLMMLPEPTRSQVREDWYQNAPQVTLDFLTNPEFEKRAVMSIPYQTTNHKTELFALLEEYLKPALATDQQVRFEQNPNLQKALDKLAAFQGLSAMLLPEMSILKVTQDLSSGLLKGEPKPIYLSMVKDNAHVNMCSIFGEHKRLVPEQTKLTLLRGVVGSYPNALFDVRLSEIDMFVSSVLSLVSYADYARLVDNYGVRRTHPDFWKISDQLHQQLKKEKPIEFGVLDLNRLENR